MNNLTNEKQTLSTTEGYMLSKYKDDELLEECKKRGLLNLELRASGENINIKYSKDQNAAVGAFLKLSEGITRKILVTLTETEVTQIKNTFGFNLWEITAPQNLVKKYIQGKQNPLLEIAFRSMGRSDVSMAKRFFEFQVKETKHTHFEFGKSSSIEDIFKQHTKSGELRTEKEFFKDSVSTWQITGYSELDKVKKDFEYRLASATRVARILQIELDVIEAVKKQISS